MGVCWGPACLVIRAGKEIILDCGNLAAGKSDFQYVRTFTDRCQLGLKPCTNRTNKAEINLNDSLAILAHEMYLLLRRQYSSLPLLGLQGALCSFVLWFFAFFCPDDSLLAKEDGTVGVSLRVRDLPEPPSRERSHMNGRPLWCAVRVEPQ